MADQIKEEKKQQTAEVLFEFLRSAIYTKNNLSLDVDSLEEEFRGLGQEMLELSRCLRETQSLAESLAKGELGTKKPSCNNRLASSLLSLHSSLEHMTRQAQQVADGDYGQRVEFIGDFAEAFNEMTDQLDTRQTALFEEIKHSQRKAEELEKSILMLEDVTAKMPQLLMVMGKASSEILYLNDASREVEARDPAVFAKIITWALSQKEVSRPDNACAVGRFEAMGTTGIHSYSASSYEIFWYGKEAIAFMMSDVTEAWEQTNALRKVAHHDILTGLYNRYYCMTALQEWEEEKKDFCLCLVDLDNLKYVNDNFGHLEGDRYIVFAAEILRKVDSGTLVCRFGGDEFVLLAPETSEAEMIEKITPLCEEFSNGKPANGKPANGKPANGKPANGKPEREKDYRRSFSFGVVDSRNHPKGENASGLLEIADERMYKNKREKSRLR